MTLTLFPSCLHFRLSPFRALQIPILLSSPPQPWTLLQRQSSRPKPFERLAFTTLLYLDLSAKKAKIRKERACTVKGKSKK